MLLLISSSNRKRIWTMLAFLVLIVLALPALAGDKKKKTVDPSTRELRH